MRSNVAIIRSFSFVIALCAAVFAYSCRKDGGAEQGHEVFDMLGRSVQVPAHVARAACVGAGALRLYSYVGDMDRLCGVEACEKRFIVAERPYQLANSRLFESLPVIGAGGPGASVDPEALVKVRPDVVFSTYNTDRKAMDKLQADTGIPVLVLSYGKTEAFDDAITSSLRIIGEVMGTEERASAVEAYVGGLKDDLKARTCSLSENERRRVYLACHSKYGTHGFGSSMAGYSLFQAVNALNVLDNGEFTGFQQSLDLETIVRLDPQVVFIDAGGMEIFKEEYSRNKEVFKLISAFRNGDVHVMLPYNAYYTNLEMAFYDAYFIGSVLYPGRFSDVDLDAKRREIFKAMLGKDIELPARVREGRLELD